MANNKGRRARFGNVRKLPSGRFQVRYTGPDGESHSAPFTFDAKGDAETWLATVRADIVRDSWNPNAGKRERERLTFGEYAAAWLRDRDLKPRTRHHYGRLLDRLLLPTFEDTELAAITPAQVRQWHALTGTSTPTLRAHAYGLLRSILGQAERDELVIRNPVHIRGAGNAKRVHKIRPLTVGELETLVEAMPEERRAMTLLAAWCAMRFGELAELRRKDLDLRNGVIRVRRAVVRVDGETIIGTPKSEAGTRDIAIPPHLIPLLKEHTEKHMQFGKDALLFPGHGGGHLALSTLYGKAPTKPTANRPGTPGHGFYGARAAAGRPDLRWHDLRHTGAVLAAQSGATLAELMGRLGHSTPGAALRYQHAAEDRDMALAKRLSALVEGGE